MLEIIYEDGNYVAINKPNGLLVHRTRIAEEKKEFALQLLRDQLGYQVYTVHRLDRGTSGVLLFAKSAQAAAAAVKAFEDKTVDKVYYTIARGYTPEEGCIDTPIKPDKDHRNRTPQEALTRYTRLATAELPIPVGRYTTARYSLVRVQPETGRMHQIRKHFAHLRHYIIGDKRHGDWRHNQMFREQLQVPYMLLHAASLTFTHPFSAKALQIKANLPAHLITLCKEFGWHEALLSEGLVPEVIPALV